MIPTIEEFLHSKGCGIKLQNGTRFFYDLEITDIKEIISIHVTEALKQASDKVEIDWSEIYPIIKKKSILNAYPLENIK